MSRITAAQRRTMEPVVATALLDMQPVLVAAEGVVVRRFAALEPELRVPAVQMLMNGIGTSLFEGLNLGLLTLEGST